MSALKEHLEVGIQHGSDLLSQLTVEQQVFRSVTRLHIVALDEQNESADRAAGEQGDMSIVSSCGAGASHLHPMPPTPCELGSFQLKVPYNGSPTPYPLRPPKRPDTAQHEIRQRYRDTTWRW